VKVCTEVNNKEQAVSLVSSDVGGCSSRDGSNGPDCKGYAYDFEEDDTGSASSTIDGGSTTSSE
jgi:hypothetical protein